MYVEIIVEVVKLIYQLDTQMQFLFVFTFNASV